MDKITKDNMNKTFLRQVGMTYDEFNQLSFDEQQRVKSKCHNKTKGEWFMIGSGEDAYFQRAGETMEDRIDEMHHSKPVAKVKKLVRRIVNIK